MAEEKTVDDGIDMKKHGGLFGISSLGKIFLEDLFIMSALAVTIGFMACKLDGMTISAAAAGVFLLLFLLFSLLFAKRCFPRRHLSRFLSIASVIAAAVLLHLMPECDCDTLEEMLQDRQLLLFAGFSVLLLALSAALRLLSYLNYRKVFSQFFEIFPQLRTGITAPWMIGLFFSAAVAAVCVCTEVCEYGNWVFSALVFLSLLSLFTLCRNPLTFREQSRLDMFFIEKGRQDANDRILENIRQRIHSRWVEAYRLPLVEHLIMFSVKLFFHLEIVGADNIAKDHLPAIFVSNHGFMLGPVCGVTYLPVVHRPYVHHRMCDVDESARRMWYCTFKPFFKRKTDEQGIRMMYHISRHITKWINSYEPIHSYVDLNNARKSMESMHDGVKSLLDGDSVLIFPEDSSKTDTGHYEEGATGALFNGFAHMGKIFNDKTGRDLYFYPVYVNKKNRTYNIAEPVVYNNSENVVEEKKRVAEELRRKMNEFAEGSLHKK